MNHRSDALSAIRGNIPSHIPYAPRFDLWFNAHEHRGTLPPEYAGCATPLDVSRLLGVGGHMVIPDYLRPDDPSGMYDRGIGIYRLPQVPYRAEIRGVERTVVDSDAAGVAQYTDTSVPLSGRKYYYWMQSVGSGGASKIAAADEGIVTSVEEITQEAAPLAFRVDQPFPNPFNPSTTIRFSLPSALHAKLTVYDALGRSVAVLVDRMMTAGVHEAVWNGRADSGASAGSGLYLYRF
jgi:hypothetical protein